jgi:gas vesicle protein
MSDEGKGAEFLAGLLIGGLVGAAAALLLAPQPGDRTREELREKGIELKERVIELSEEARKVAEDLQTESRSIVDEQKSRLGEAIQEGKKAAAKKKKELLEDLEKQSDGATS